LIAREAALAVPARVKVGPQSTAAAKSHAAFGRGIADSVYREHVKLQSSPEGASGMTERRLARRYDLSLPVNIRMPINMELRSHSGQTRDISTRGVYFTLQDDLVPGSELDFTLTLPAEITRGSEVFVRAHGRVIRVDKRSDDDHETIGVAAVIERYDIVRGEGSRA
jgi:PilZ domain